MDGGRRSSTMRQLELLLEFAEGNLDLALGRLRSKEAREVSSRLWRECADSLNCEGPAKLPKEWAKVWNDMKSKVRSKMMSITVSQQASGDIISNVTLTALEDRVANIIGWDIGSLSSVTQDPFQQVSMEENCEMVLEHVDPNDHQPSSSPQPLSTQSQQSPRPSSPLQPQPSMPPSPSSTPPPRQRQQRPHHRPRRGSRMLKNRGALEETRAMMLRIEELRAQTDNLLAQSTLKQAEAARAQAEAAVITAQSNRLQAQTMATISQSLSVLVPAVRLYFEQGTHSELSKMVREVIVEADL